MCYSPVRHCLPPKGEDVRLACVRHAASVYPEPGSNSPSQEKKHATHGEPRESSLGELRSRPSCCSCSCPLLGCSQMLLAFVPSAPMRSKRREGSILTGTACWCAVHDATLVRWFFALTKKQLLFCFP